MKILNVVLSIDGIFLGKQRCIRMFIDNVTYEPAECNDGPEFVWRDEESRDDRVVDDDEEKDDE